MGIDLYFKKGIEEDAKFKNLATNMAYFGDTELKNKGGRWFIILPSLLIQISKELESYIEQISLHEYIQTDSPRRMGKYAYKTAVAHLSLYNQERQNMRTLSMVGTSLSDMLALYEGILNGKIAPQEPWDLPQTVPEKINPLRMLLIKISIWWDKYIRKDTTKTY